MKFTIDTDVMGANDFDALIESIAAFKAFEASRAVERMCEITGLEFSDEFEKPSPKTSNRGRPKDSKNKKKA